MSLQLTEFHMDTHFTHMSHTPHHTITILLELSPLPMPTMTMSADTRPQMLLPSTLIAPNMTLLSLLSELHTDHLLQLLPKLQLSHLWFRLREFQYLLTQLSFKMMLPTPISNKEILSLMESMDLITSRQTESQSTLTQSL